MGFFKTYSIFLTVSQWQSDLADILLVVPNAPRPLPVPSPTDLSGPTDSPWYPTRSPQWSSPVTGHRLVDHCIARYPLPHTVGPCGVAPFYYVHAVGCPPDVPPSTPMGTSYSTGYRSTPLPPPGRRLQHPEHPRPMHSRRCPSGMARCLDPTDTHASVSVPGLYAE